MGYMMQIRKAPKTEAVYLKLKEQIASGMYPTGMLPVEPELAEQLQVARKTLRSALTRLALENYIVRIKGEGTFINRSAKEAGRILVMVRDEERGISIPVVDEAVCIGCGACENLCPSRPVSAITVNGRHNHLDI